jgi:class 3 adenylate cyclase/predicted ATPase
MEFYAVLDQVIDLLRSRGRMSYRALQRQFHLDEAFLDDLKEELLYAHPVIDDHGRGLVWTGAAATHSAATFTPPAQCEATQQDQPTQSEPPPPESPTPDAERRQLTVMFSDLVDSTKLSGQLDPEDYRDVVRAYQATCAEVIHRYDGHIAQHLGDALLVYFGYPQAHEDDAQRAIHVGLGMLDAMQALNTRLEQEKGIRLALRVGIHTGLTVIGDIGEGWKPEHLALGATPNIAARIQGLAAPDAVAISAATCRLVQGYFACEDLGFHTLKGVPEPQQVYRVLGESEARSRLDIAATRGLTPLVGRESEVTLLLERWAQVKDGHGHVVLLGGEAGIGKSRLVQVLKDHVVQEPHFRWECRCSPYFHNSALYPVIDLFQRAFQFQPDDVPANKLQKMEETVHPYVPLPDVMPLFASLLSVPFDDRYAPLTLTPERQKQQTLEAVLMLLLAMAARQPALFILEDLHWADPSTLELLALLLDQVPTAQLLTLLTSRPAFQPTWSHRSYLTEVTLNRLSRSQIAQMVEHITGGKRLPAEIMQQLVEKTDGVPLFVEEMTKALLESGHLQDVDGQYERTGPFASLGILTTLHDSLMARLDRLVSAKGIAQLGAVIGRQFSYALLQAVSQLDDATLHRELARLVQAELVYQRGLPPQGTYLFKHALVRDVAYASLLKSTRQQYHQRIAQVLAARFPEIAETQPELLAHHYTESDCHQKAAMYWRRAGERASAGSAYVEAVVHFQKGLDVLQPLPETAEWAELELPLQLGLGASLIVSQGWTAPAVEHAYARAYALCQQLGEPPALIRVLQELRRLYALRGDRGATQKARELGEQLLALAQRQNDSVLLQEAHWALGQTFYYLGELNATRRHLEQSSAFYTPKPLTSQTSRDQAGTQIACLFYTDLVLWMLGYPDQALRASHDALALAHELSHPFTLAFAFSEMAMIHQLRREVQEMRQQTEAMMALANEQGFAVYTHYGTIYRAWTLTMEDEQQEAITQIQQAMVTLRAGIDDWALYYAQLAEAYGVVGQTEEGLRSVAEALELTEKTGFRVYEPELHRVQGELLLQQAGSDASQAEACFRKAIAIARSQQAKSWELRAATSLARLWQSQGKCQEGRELLVPVYEWFTEGFGTKDLQDAKALLDELA